ncbi:DUF2142 domain-containing protein [Nakamurella leprariae]|uniref:DUF2142 domain-containing protein n=1 Tax=Nakamurella leprariae TaxID=2803911 RepID=A0A938YBS6_9ACTN|nr:DUF2142 domain-containing protein [Nakamurella leprariae]MBM9467717.1 DUF2142 domain-containing protein [Nakamurella leprariae]
MNDHSGPGHRPEDPDGDGRAHGSRPTPLDTTGVGPGDGPRWQWRIWAVLTAALFVLGLAWTLLTPPGAQPDEPQHTQRAWAVWDGQVLAPPTPDGTALLQLPSGLLEMGNVGCFAFFPNQDAGCRADWPLTDDRVDLNNTAGRYNPVYYLVTGLPIRIFEPETGLYLSRALSALVAAGVLAAGLHSLLLLRRSWVGRAAALAVMTPVCVSLLGGYNPSAWEITGAVTGCTSLLLLARFPHHPAVRAWAWCAAVALSLMAMTRIASFVWVAVFVGFAAVLAGRGALVLARRTDVRLAGLVVATATAWALVWQQLAGARDVSVTGFSATLGEGLEASYAASAGWWAQMIGYLGWNDVPPTTFAVWGTVAVVGALLLGGLAVAGRWHRWLLLLALAGAVLLPIVMSAVVYRSVGMIWQGRYNLPLTLLPVLWAALLWDTNPGTDDAVRRRLAGATLVVWVAVTVSMSYTVLKRYAVGLPTDPLSGDDGFLFRPVAWAPPGGVWIWLLIGAAAAVAVALLMSPTAAGAARWLGPAGDSGRRPMRRPVGAPPPARHDQPVHREHDRRPAELGDDPAVDRRER